MSMPVIIGVVIVAWLFFGKTGNRPAPVGGAARAVVPSQRAFGVLIRPTSADPTYSFVGALLSMALCFGGFTLYGMATTWALDHELPYVWAWPFIALGIDAFAFKLAYEGLPDGYKAHLWLAQNGRHSFRLIDFLFVVLGAGSALSVMGMHLAVIMGNPKYSFGL